MPVFMAGPPAPARSWGFDSRSSLVAVPFAGPSAPASHGALGSRPSLVASVASLPPLLSPGREGPVTAKRTAFLLAVVFLAYAVLLGWRGVLLIGTGDPVAAGLGIAVLVIPVLGAYLVWREL